MTTMKMIGGFRVLQELQVGSGSQGTVYKAVCETAREGIAAVGDVVALKVMAVQDEGQTLWRRLEHRTRELMQLDHPNIVRYKGCFVEAGPFADIHVVVQEFLEGETLKDCLSTHPGGLDVDRGIAILKAALDGLIYTSGRGIVHRDIKPGNIFLCSDGGVKLIDFEIARQEGGTATTATGNIRGSFDYMAPDFINATFHGDIQSDVFSMGVVMHEVLTGKTPYQRFNSDQKQANFAFLSRWSHSSDGASPIHISSRVRRLLANADGVLAKALAQDRAARYPDFSSFRQDIRTIRYRDLRNGETTYRILQYIGKGGFGEVFKARLQQTNELVAIKHLLKAAYAERFMREAKIMRKLHDPCFVQFMDFFISERAGGKDAFLVMAFLDGMPGNSLRDAIRNVSSEPGKVLPKIDVLCAFRRYAHGLHVMHAQGIFHRDIKPSNLYYPPNAPTRAAIMDLGIARDVNGTATTGQVPGTLDYMPPEVVLSDSRGDSGMDIYALGLCLYEALTGKMGYPRLPSGTAAYTAFFARARDNKPPVFDAQPVAGDSRLLELLLEMTCPDAAKRIKDASVVVERLDALILDAGGTPGMQSPEKDEATQATTIATTPFTVGTISSSASGMRRVSPSRKKPMLAAGLLLLLAAGIGGVFAYRKMTNRVPEVPISTSPESAEMTTPAGIDVLKPVGYVRFQLKDGFTCQFQEKEVVSTDPVLLPTGNYECVYYNQEVDGKGNRRYAPEHVNFSIATNSIARVGVPSMWRETPEFLAQKKAESEIENAKKVADLAKKEEQQAELERKKAEAAAAEAAAEIKRIKEEAARMKAEAERLKKEAEEERRLIELQRLSSMSNATERAVLEKKLEQEREEAKKKAMAEQLAREAREREWRAKAAVDATNRFWKLVLQLEPVASRRERLLDAEAIYRTTVTSNLLETAASGQLFDELVARRGWVVGRISNTCSDPIEVDGRRIAAASSELFVLTNGLPQRWEAHRAGYETLSLTRQFDGKEVSLDSGAFVKSSLSVSVPKLSAGTVCIVDGEERTGAFRRKPGQTVTYAYRRHGYTYRGTTSYLVTERTEQQLPAPKDSDWEILPVQVWVPRMMAGVSCWVDGREVPGGGTVTNIPGRSMSCTYRRKGYKEVQKTYVVMMANYQELPAPRFDEWKPMTVVVAVPQLLAGVTCNVDGNAVSGREVALYPGRHTCKYVRPDYQPQQVEFLVKDGDRVTIPSPGEWVASDALRGLEAAEVAAKKGDWGGVERLLRQADVTASTNVERKQKLVKMLGTRANVSKTVEQAEIYYSDESWKHVVRCFAEARSTGYVLSANDLSMVDESYSNERARIKTIRERVLREMSIGKSPSYDLSKLDEEESQLHEWYNAIKK